MPINPTTLKALIDTQITDETVNLAITPAEVGGRMKDTIDYTTEQIALAEVLTNKSTNVATDGLSNTKYPSVSKYILKSRNLRPSLQCSNHSLLPSIPRRLLPRHKLPL